MTKNTGTIGLWGVGLLCVATMIVTTIHRKETIRQKEREIASLESQLVEVKRDLFHQRSVGSVLNQVMTVEDWRGDRSHSQSLMEQLRNSDDERVQRMVSSAESYIETLDEAATGVLDSGVDLMIQDVVERLRSELSAEDVEILETMLNSEDWMNEFRSLVEVSVANQMRVLDTP